jgi:hypothetical protein
MIHDHELMRHEAPQGLANAGLDGGAHHAFNQAFGSWIAALQPLHYILHFLFNSISSVLGSHLGGMPAANASGRLRSFYFLGALAFFR